MAAAVFRTIFAQPDAEAVNSGWDQVQGQLAASFPKTGALMGDAKADVLALAAFPRAHWQKTWSTNPLERINKEIKRRSRVVGVIPNQASAIRLAGAILADLHDKWQTTDRRYVSEDSMSLLYPERDTITTAELTTGNQHRGITQSPPPHGTLPSPKSYAKGSLHAIWPGIRTTPEAFDRLRSSLSSGMATGLRPSGRGNGGTRGGL